MYPTGNKNFDVAAQVAEAAKEIAYAAAYTTYPPTVPSNDVARADALAAADLVYFAAISAAGITYGVQTLNSNQALSGQPPPVYGTAQLDPW